MFEIGTHVRLRNDPGRSGEVTGARVFAGAPYVQVRLSDGSGSQNYPVDQLESMDTAPDALADLRAGKLSAPEDFRRLLIHTRLTGNLSDVIYSMEATNTDFHAYQFKPVIKLLNSPSRGLLIADEVGLGKTIEAGLIWTELAARFDASRLLVVCPKSLTEKWKLELRNKFSLAARVTDAGGLLQALKDESESSEGFALICSLPSLRPPKAWEDEAPKRSDRIGLPHYLRDRSDEQSQFDLVIFDEAHHLRNPETLQHGLARMIMTVADYRLLLSATPINLRSEDLRSLLRLLDPDTFDNEFVFAQMEEENEPLVAAREKVLNKDVPIAQVAAQIAAIPAGEVLRTDRRMAILREQLATGIADLPANRVAIAAQLEEMSLLGSIVNRTRRRDVQDLQVKRDATVRTWGMNAEERTFYDEASAVVREHAWRIPAPERFLLATPQRLIASSLPAAFAHWGSGRADTSLDDPDAEPGDLGPLVGKLAILCRDPARLAALEAGDTKLALLLTAIEQNWRRRPDEKLIVFSSFRRTIDYLDRRLRAGAIATEKLHGSIAEDRQDVLDRFASAQGAVVLLTSEVGGEGLDLQFCRTMINFDLPWNPMKIEQRIGRIDRIGQKAERIEIMNLICEDTIEAQVYGRLYERIGLIERTLGSFETILGEEMVGLERRLLDPALDDDERRGLIDRASIAIENRHRLQEEVEEEAAGLIAHGDMILKRIHDSHRDDRRIGAEELADYLRSAIEGRYGGSRLLPLPESGAFTLKLSAPANLDFVHYLDAFARRHPTRAHKDGGRVLLFGKTDPSRPHAEIVGPVHPLIRFAAHIRQAASERSPMRPAVVVDVPASAIGLEITPGTYLAAAQLWSTRGIVDSDRIAFAGLATNGELLGDDDAEQLCRRALEQGTVATAPAPQLSAWAETIAERLLAGELPRRFELFVTQEKARHEDRAATEIAQIDRQLQRRRDADQARIDEWIASGEANKLRIVPAAQAKLDKFAAHMELKLANARKKADFGFAPEVTLGVLVVNLTD